MFERDPGDFGLLDCAQSWIFHSCQTTEAQPARIYGSKRVNIFVECKIDDRFSFSVCLFYFFSVDQTISFHIDSVKSTVGRYIFLRLRFSDLYKFAETAEEKVIVRHGRV